MKWHEEAELYLRVQLGSQQRLKHAGLRLLKDNADIAYPNLQEYILLAHNKVSSLCSLDTDLRSASGALTNISSSIGRDIMSTFGGTYEQADWKDYLRLGDLMLEVFLQLKLITITSPPPRSREPILVTIGEDWPSELPPEVIKRSLRGVFSEKPKDISGPTQMIQYSASGLRYHKKIIKRWNEKLDGNVRDMLDTPWARAINKLQQTPWTINSQVLEAVKSKPHKFFSEKSSSLENMSKRIDFDYTITKACALDGEVFYTAADMDYRGRIYFVESFLNFQGSDLARGLLTFAESKPVTASGLRWLKIHCASSFNQSYPVHDIPTWVTSDYKGHLESEGLDDISVDKMTLQDREAWCDNNMQLITETVEGSIIHDCEKPVGFLGAAIELYNYYACDGVYSSSLPIPIDGSNNGWQHLGAISKDPLTGKLVGLEPVEIQNDFYVQTAKRLIEITKDSERNAILNKMPMKAIRKGISKRGSMTRAYSAGAQKIAENMYQDCKSAGYAAKYGIKEEHCKGFARDLVKAISDVCPGPLLTMKYLQQLAADRLNQDYNFITWQTPAGFKVVYENFHKDQVKFSNRIRGVGNVQDKVKHTLKMSSTCPDRRGFMCGISPNFIHSQDASHMQIVIDKFDGLFGAVHDSFSTHASDVDTMLDITKQVFVDMYDVDNYYDNISARLSAEAEQPTLGNLKITNVLTSSYFFA